MSSGKPNLENLARAKQLNAEPPASTMEAEDIIKLTGELHRLVLARLKPAK
jgi:hypothetical protein